MKNGTTRVSNDVMREILTNIGTNKETLRYHGLGGGKKLSNKKKTKRKRVVKKKTKRKY
jgi:hypothetical protein